MRKFLYTIAFLTVLVVGALFGLRIWQDDLTRVAFVPQTAFVQQDALDLNAYQDPDMWFSRPGKGAVNDPARWQPQFAEIDTGDGDTAEQSRAADAADAPLTTGGDTADGEPVPPDLRPSESDENQRFAVFFVHPTSFFDRGAWNAQLDDADSQNRARIMVRGLASVFNQASEIWVPRYRQATFGAFLTDVPQATSAIDAAYVDIGQAFDFFIDSVPADMPIVLAGHSQGSYHILRLLQERGDDPALQARIAMVYAIGWPISLEGDLPTLSLPACQGADQPGCIFSYASFAEPAEPGLFFRRYAATPGLDGKPRGESPILCVNPLTGTQNGEADAAANLGTLLPNEDFSSGELLVGAVPARCGERGLLLIGDPPEIGNQVFPGNNYHLVDIPLFWENLQQDVVTRMRTWQSRIR